MAIHFSILAWRIPWAEEPGSYSLWGHKKSNMTEKTWHALKPTRLLCPWDFPARILEWVAISLARGSSWIRDWTHVSYMSYIGRWVLYHWASRESCSMYSLSHLKSVRLSVYFHTQISCIPTAILSIFCIIIKRNVLKTCHMIFDLWILLLFLSILFCFI